MAKYIGIYQQTWHDPSVVEADTIEDIVNSFRAEYDDEDIKAENIIFFETSAALKVKTRIRAESFEITTEQ